MRCCLASMEDEEGELRMVDPNDVQDDSIVARARYQLVEASRLLRNTMKGLRNAAVQGHSHDPREQALSAALHRLEAPDKRLLELHFLAGLSIDQLGRIYAIDRATAAHRLNRILLRLRTTIHVLGPVAERSGLGASPRRATPG